MKLVNSIVILERNEPSSRVIDLVLLVKHPDGCDPIERIQAAIGDFIKTQRAEIGHTEQKTFTWSDLIHRMQGWDWSAQGLFVQEAPLWSVIGDDDNMLQQFVIVT